MLTVTINQDMVEERIHELAACHNKSEEQVVHEVLAHQLGLGDLLYPVAGSLIEVEPPAPAERAEPGISSQV